MRVDRALRRAGRGRRGRRPRASGPCGDGLAPRLRSTRTSSRERHEPPARAGTRRARAGAARLARSARRARGRPAPARAAPARASRLTSPPSASAQRLDDGVGVETPASPAFSRSTDEPDLRRGVLDEPVHVHDAGVRLEEVLDLPARASRAARVVGRRSRRPACESTGGPGGISVTLTRAPSGGRGRRSAGRISLAMSWDWRRVRALRREVDLEVAPSGPDAGSSGARGR